MGMFVLFTYGLALLGIIGTVFFALRAIFVALRTLVRR
jgi:hypothetical protein